jgi:hypothetical protein
MATEAEIRAALKWETGQDSPEEKSTWVWLWEAIQGDFNDNRSVGQIAFDAAVSIIPVVDQICDVRDIIANCRGIATAKEGDDNTWKWVALALTLIGLFPSLGSVVKGVLKIFFVFVRRYGLNQLLKAMDDAMTWVVTFLRKREVQKILRELKVDEVFKWLADVIKVKVKAKLNAGELLAAFDKGIGLMKKHLGKVADLPIIGPKAKATMAMVQGIRNKADAHLGKALAPLQKAIDAIIHRLEMESLVQRSGILDAKNVHFRGTLPEARAVTLMRQADPLPSWLSKGRKGKWAEQDLADGQLKLAKERAKDSQVPDLTPRNIQSFHKMEVKTIEGPAKLYRVVSPTNGAMSDCWIPEDVWEKIKAAPDPKAAWRKYSAVWPDWNPNGQFVVLEVPPGQTLKVWRGPAASQVKDKRVGLDAHLEGGWDQVIFKPKLGQWDTTRIYKLGGGQGNVLRRTDMSYATYNNLPTDQKALYAPVREKINHPNIKGPLDTGWGATDFDLQWKDGRIGLPTLPGQVTN